MRISQASDGFSWSSVWRTSLGVLKFLRGTPWPAVLIISVLIVLAIFGHWIAPFPPNQGKLPDRLTPPVWQDGGTWSHPIGTDNIGRDILSRLIVGTRTSLTVAAIAIAAGVFVGTVVGLVSGLAGGKVDNLLMRAADIMIGFPIILFAILLAVVVGPKMSNVVLAISLFLWARFARMVRGEVLSLRERDFVALARISGASQLRIMVQHLLPNVANTIIVLASLEVGTVIVVEASLSFLGAGVPPPTPAWGSMIGEGRDFVTTAWWVPAMPGFAIMLTVLSFNLIGDWFRDTFDPKLRSL